VDTSRGSLDELDVRAAVTRSRRHCRCPLAAEPVAQPPPTRRTCSVAFASEEHRVDPTYGSARSLYWLARGASSTPKGEPAARSPSLPRGGGGSSPTCGVGSTDPSQFRYALARARARDVRSFQKGNEATSRCRHRSATSPAGRCRPTLVELHRANDLERHVVPGLRRIAREISELGG
jgi:hypothetical protein